MDEGKNWTRFRVTTEQCPRITEEFLEERRTMPRQWFRSEYFCEFTDTVDSVFSTDDIDAAFSDDVEPLFGSAEEAKLPTHESEEIEPLVL